MEETIETSIEINDETYVCEYFDFSCVDDVNTYLVVDTDETVRWI